MRAFLALDRFHRLGPHSVWARDDVKGASFGHLSPSLETVHGCIARTFTDGAQRSGGVGLRAGACDYGRPRRRDRAARRSRVPEPSRKTPSLGPTDSQFVLARIHRQTFIRGDGAAPHSRSRRDPRHTTRAATHRRGSRPDHPVRLLLDELNPDRVGVTHRPCTHRS